MYESIFTYSITRHYPYRWLTWLVVIGGIAMTVLFSVINLAATGYEPSSIYVVSPNETEHPQHLRWIERRPWSWSNKVLSTCQSQTLSIGTKIYTTSLALRYTVYDIHQGHDPSNDTTSLFSIAYQDDYLQDCVIRYIQLNPVDNNGVSGLDLLNLDAMVHCLLYENSKPITVTLRLLATVTEFGVSSTTGARGFNDQFHDDAPTSMLLALASIFFYNGLRTSPLTPGYGASWTTDQTSMAVPARDRSVLDIHGAIPLNNLSTIQVGGNANLSAPLWTSTIGNEMVAAGLFTEFQDGEEVTMNSTSDQNIREAVYLDGLAKSLYSLILTDLGQSGEDNIFASPERAMDFIDLTTQLLDDRQDLSLSTQCISARTSTVIPNDQRNITEFYKQCGNGSLPQVDPVRIAQQYLCQVPRLKSTSSLVVGIIIADLVFLQTLRTVLNWVMTFLVQRKNPSAHYCIGCMNACHASRTDELNLHPTDATEGMDAGSKDSQSAPTLACSPVATEGELVSAVMSVVSDASSVSSASIRRGSDSGTQPLLSIPYHRN